jgi:polar amino acid transport system substrate-binding protein
MPRRTNLSSAAHSETGREPGGSGRVRIGLVQAPAASTFFVSVRQDGTPNGVTVALGNALAGSLGLVPQFDVRLNSGELTDALESGAIDVAFMPRDEERERRVDFGPAYFLIESTALVHDESGFRKTSDLDRPGARVVGIANTTTIRGATRRLPNAAIISAASVKEALDLLASRRADAVVLSRDVLSRYLAELPETRLLEGTIHSTGISVAVRKGRPELLASVRSFMTEAKSSGLVRRAFDAAGFHTESVAPSEDSAAI